MHKTKKLIESNVDLVGIYSEKQKDVKEKTGYELDLAGVVDLLREETSDFTKENEVALKLDNEIYSLVIKYYNEKGEKLIWEKEPDPEPKKIVFPDTKGVKEIIDVILSTQMVIDDKLWDNAEEEKEIMEIQALNFEVLSDEVGSNVTIEDVLSFKN